MTAVVIGGGWSGLACAVSLAKQGHPVHLFEAANQLGGRACNVVWQDKTVDNGQHLMIGAYSSMLSMMQLVGIQLSDAFNRSALDITIHDSHFNPLLLSAKGWLPWPLSLACNLLKSTGINGLLDISRLQKNIPILLSSNDISVADWLSRTKQSPRLIHQLWEPICLATLNTPITSASAQMLARVLDDSLGKHRTAADLLVPRQPLTTLFPEAAAAYIQHHGGHIALSTRIKRIVINNDHVKGILTQDDVYHHADSVVVAGSPSQQHQLLAPHITFNNPDEYPICTVYLQYPTSTRLPSPLLGMTGTLSQWIFDRSIQHPGLMAVVISGPGHHLTISKQQLITQVSQEVHQLLPTLIPCEPETSYVIRQKRATFASVVDIEKQRPTSQTSIQGLWLAGDYVANAYPATLEGAIRNGEQCAQQILTMTNVDSV